MNKTTTKFNTLTRQASVDECRSATSISTCTRGNKGSRLVRRSLSGRFEDDLPELHERCFYKTGLIENNDAT